MTNLLEQAIDCDDPHRAARIIQEALGIESGRRRELALPERMAALPSRMMRCSNRNQKYRNNPT
jgi:hypothetical protein